MPMVRTQIQLTDQQARRLRAQARDRGLSLAEVIRRCVDKGLAEEMPDGATLYDRTARVVGRFHDLRGGTRKDCCIFLELKVKITQVVASRRTRKDCRYHIADLCLPVNHDYSQI